MARLRSDGERDSSNWIVLSTVIILDFDLNFRMDGQFVIVQCHQELLINPPPIGSQITVKYAGVYETNKKLKRPFFWRERKEEDSANHVRMSILLIQEAKTRELDL